MLVHDFIDIDEIDALAIVGHHLLDKRAALKAFLMAEIEGLGCIEELDSQHSLVVFTHLVALRGSVATHADEVLLVLAAGDAVDTAGSAELFALAYDAGGSILRNHETAVETGLGHKEAGQTAFGID